MKRKLIRQGGGGYTVYLPKKWVETIGLAVGDKVSIDEEGNTLVLNPELKEHEPKTIEVDIEGLDKASVRQTFTALYESGFDEITFTFKNNPCMDPYAKTKLQMSDVIVNLVPRFHGFEIIKQDDLSYTVKDISHSSEDDFDIILRRIFFLLLDFNKYIQENKFRQGRERYEAISRFVSFCLRLLNKKQIPDPVKYNLYTVTNSLEDIAIYYRFLTEDRQKRKISEDTRVFIKQVGNTFKMFYEFYYSPDNKKLTKINRSIADLENQLKQSDVRHKEFMIIYRFSTILDVIYANLKCVLAMKK